MAKFSEYVAGKLFSESQQRILRDCINANKEEYTQWMVTNVIIPSILISVPVLLYYLIKSDVSDSRALIFNGSLSIMGITILYGMSSYLIKLNKPAKTNSSNEEDPDFDDYQLNEDMVSLRTRLGNYKNLLVILGSICYIIQALFTHYNSNCAFYLFIILTFLILIGSIYVGRLMFVIKDDFFDRTYYNQVNKPITETRQRWDAKFNNEPEV